MRYLKIIKADIANGTGFRVSIWVSGCSRHCKGCFNQESWPFEAGKVFDAAALKKLLNELAKDTCDGLSVLGGEPLDPRNVPGVLAICREAKALCPNKTIWLWTGFLMEALSDEQGKVLDYVDVLVDGPFIQDLKDTSLVWKGSSNQRIFKKVDGKFQVVG